MSSNQGFYLSATPATLCVCLQVSLPTRFIFLVLGPPESTSIWEYHPSLTLHSVFVYRSHCPPGLSSWYCGPLRAHLSGSTTPHSLYTLCLFTGLTAHQVYLPGVGAPWEHIYLGVPPLTHSTLCVCLQVSLPTRFIFLVLGPPDSTSIWEYHP